MERIPWHALCFCSATNANYRVTSHGEECKNPAAGISTVLPLPEANIDHDTSKAPVCALLFAPFELNCTLWPLDQEEMEEKEEDY